MSNRKIDYFNKTRQCYDILNELYSKDHLTKDWNDFNCNPTSDEWNDPLRRNYKYVFISLKKQFDKIEMFPVALDISPDDIQTTITIAFEELKYRFSNWYFVFFDNKFKFHKIHKPFINIEVPSNVVGYTYIKENDYDIMIDYFNNEIKDFLLNQNLYKYISHFR